MYFFRRLRLRCIGWCIRQLAKWEEEVIEEQMQSLGLSKIRLSKISTTGLHPYVTVQPVSVNWFNESSPSEMKSPPCKKRDDVN